MGVAGVRPPQAEPQEGRTLRASSPEPAEGPSWRLRGDTGRTVECELHPQDVGIAVSVRYGAETIHTEVVATIRRTRDV
jgi:hypothetical protein